LLLHSSPITSSVCNFFFFFAAYYNIWYPCAPQIDSSSMPHTLPLFSTGNLVCGKGGLDGNSFKVCGTEIPESCHPYMRTSVLWIWRCKLCEREELQCN